MSTKSKTAVEVLGDALWAALSDDGKEIHLFNDGWKARNDHAASLIAAFNGSGYGIFRLGEPGSLGGEAGNRPPPPPPPDRG